MFEKEPVNVGQVLCAVLAAKEIPAKLKVISDYIQSQAKHISEDGMEDYETILSAARSEYLHAVVSKGDFSQAEKILDTLPADQYEVYLRSSLVAVDSPNQTDRSIFLSQYVRALLNPTPSFLSASFGETTESFDYPAMLKALKYDFLDPTLRGAIVAECNRNFEKLYRELDEQDLETQMTALDDVTALINKIPNNCFDFHEHVDLVAGTLLDIIFDEERLQRVSSMSMSWIENFFSSQILMESFVFQAGPDKSDQAFGIIEELVRRIEQEHPEYAAYFQSTYLLCMCELLKTHPQVNSLASIAADVIIEPERAGDLEDDLADFSPTACVAKIAKVLEPYLEVAERHGIVSEYHLRVIQKFSGNLDARLAMLVDEVEFLLQPGFLTARSSEYLRDVLFSEKTLLHSYLILNDLNFVEGLNGRVNTYLRCCEKGYYLLGNKGEESQERYVEAFEDALSIVKALSEIEEKPDLAKLQLKHLKEFARTLGSGDSFVRILQEKVLSMVCHVYGPGETAEVVHDLLRFALGSSEELMLYRLSIFGAYGAALRNSTNREFIS